MRWSHLAFLSECQEADSRLGEEVQILVSSLPLAPRSLDVEKIKAEFANGAPFRYAVIDNFFDEAVALTLHHSFPIFSKLDEFKARLFAGRAYGPPPDHASVALSDTFSALASADFIRSLSEISGIEQLAMDETNEGAGVHIGLRGSELPIHADHNTHPKAPWLYRRLNLLIYINPNWNPSWRSNLLLCDGTGSQKLVQIEPRFNRAVLMEVHDNAFHGYDVLQLPDGETRQSLAAYFYSPERSMNQKAEPHGTLFAASGSFRKRTKRSLLHRFRSLALKPRW